MTKNKKARLTLAIGLLCSSAALIIRNFHWSDSGQGFLMGIGLVLTVYGFIAMQSKQQA